MVEWVSIAKVLRSITIRVEMWDDDRDLHPIHIERIMPIDDASIIVPSIPERGSSIPFGNAKESLTTSISPEKFDCEYI